MGGGTDPLQGGGEKAPAFALKDKARVTHRLSSFESDFVVLFFYPKDNTPGCAIEARAFSKDLKKFEKLGATLVGISGGDETTKQKFCEKHKLKTILLSDPDFKVSKKYGVYGKKSFMGKSFNGNVRATFVINDKRKVARTFDKVKPPVHSKEVITFLKDL